MPTYAYHCENCGHQFEEIIPLSQYKEPQPCPQCETLCSKEMSAVGLNFPGWDWAGKNNRVRNQMRKKNERLTRKQNELKMDGGTYKLTPNVGGEQVDSWAEAAKLAKSKGKKTEGYEARARQEKKDKSK